MKIAIEGSLGSGKTTLARSVSKRLSVDAVLERYEQNPFLEDFYLSDHGNEFETEIVFLMIHYNQLRRANTIAGLICDFTIEKDLLFAERNLEGEQLGVFRSIHRYVASQLPKPDLTVILTLDREHLHTRLRARGRSMEKGISGDFLFDLQQDILKNSHRLWGKVAIIDVGLEDSVEKLTIAVCDQIQNQLG